MSSSAKEDSKHMFCYLNFCCYFEANGQNHIHFQLIHVLKNSMAWYFLTITAPSSKLEFVYPPCCRVKEQMPVNAWTSQRLFKSNPQVNHRTHLKDCTPAYLTAVATDTSRWRFFFCLFKPEFSWMSINRFHGFPRALTEKVPSSLNEGRIILNDDGFLNYFIKMKDYIVKTTRSLRAE